MSVTLADNALISDLNIVKDRIGLTSSITTYDDILKLLINEVSTKIETHLKVLEGSDEYFCVIKQRTLTNIIFNGNGKKKCFIPYYPLASISSLKYTEDYSAYKDYISPYVKADSYSIYLPNDYFRENTAGNKATIVCGYAVTPQDIIGIALELIQRTVQESGIEKIGKNLLGVSSQGVNSQATSSISLFDLTDKHEKILKKYRRPNIAQQITVSK